MEDRETPRIRKYGESKTTRIMMATVPHVTSGSGLRKFQGDGFLSDRVYSEIKYVISLSSPCCLFFRTPPRKRHFLQICLCRDLQAVLHTQLAGTLKDVSNCVLVR